MNLEWTFVLFTHFGVTTGITQGFRVIPEVTPKWVNNTNVHSKFTLISLFSKIHSLKSERIHSFLFREYSYAIKKKKKPKPNVTRIVIYFLWLLNMVLHHCSFEFNDFHNIMACDITLRWARFFPRPRDVLPNACMILLLFFKLYSEKPLLPDQY